jgi:hypothetical protein
MHGCRSRNDGNGQLRQKRADTQASTIENQYNVDLGVRGDMQLGTLRRLANANSIEAVIAKLGATSR